MGCSSCGGGLAAPAMQMRLESVRARGVAAATLVRIRYGGEDRKVRPYVVEGKVYFFGATERRREGVVPSRVAWQFLEVGGRFYGSFEVVESSESVVAAEPVGASGDAEPAGAADDGGAVAGAGSAIVGVAAAAAPAEGGDAGSDSEVAAATGGVMPRKGGGKRGG